MTWLNIIQEFQIFIYKYVQDCQIQKKTNILSLPSNSVQKKRLISYGSNEKFTTTTLPRFYEYLMLELLGIREPLYNTFSKTLFRGAL